MGGIEVVLYNSNRNLWRTRETGSPGGRCRDDGKRIGPSASDGKDIPEAFGQENKVDQTAESWKQQTDRAIEGSQAVDIGLRKGQGVGR